MLNYESFTIISYMNHIQHLFLLYNREAAKVALLSNFSSYLSVIYKMFFDKIVEGFFVYSQYPSGLINCLLPLYHK